MYCDKYSRSLVLLVTYSSVVCNGMSRGISLRPRPAQSTVVPSHWHMDGQSESMRHSPDSFIRNSSQEPAQLSSGWVCGCGCGCGWGVVRHKVKTYSFTCLGLPVGRTYIWISPRAKIQCAGDASASVTHSVLHLSLWDFCANSRPASADCSHKWKDSWPNVYTHTHIPTHIYVYIYLFVYMYKYFSLCCKWKERKKVALSICSEWNEGSEGSWRGEQRSSGGEQQRMALGKAKLLLPVVDGGLRRLKSARALRLQRFRCLLLLSPTFWKLFSKAILAQEPSLAMPCDRVAIK